MRIACDVTPTFSDISTDAELDNELENLEQKQKLEGGNRRRNNVNGKFRHNRRSKLADEDKGKLIIN